MGYHARRDAINRVSAGWGTNELHTIFLKEG